MEITFDRDDQLGEYGNEFGASAFDQLSATLIIKKRK